MGKTYQRMTIEKKVKNDAEKNYEKNFEEVRKNSTNVFFFLNDQNAKKLMNNGVLENVLQGQ